MLPDELSKRYSFENVEMRCAGAGTRRPSMEMAVRRACRLLREIARVVMRSYRTKKTCPCLSNVVLSDAAYTILVDLAFM